ncbi:hypothetical protein TRFO_10328 [Tritrichomonas foetus]|uniref:Uncharacterized protein n=1 Tax=Tritrichomonas foetus TaxID=1144522 RepID=A0A1J4J972_9EUKA|nr:hypothetical protein TRFO_10328 [Tritrichomonas foetus]|eukprot:OHS95696.1 hypothetical protein TRFO_10328 [Tritrichomonas foetus]
MSKSFAFPDDKEIDKFIKYTPNISLNTDDSLRIDYGSEKSLPTEPPIIPETAEESIEHAGEYVIKQNNKGFCVLPETEKDPKTIYKSSLVKYQKMKIELQKKALVEEQKNKILESYQSFWQTSDVVKKTAKELSDLPFIDAYDQNEVEGKFRDNVAAFVRVMKHDGMLDDDNKKSRNQLLEITRIFYLKIREIRHNMIDKYLSMKMLDYDKLSPGLQNEFIQYKPIPKAVESYPITDKKSEDFDRKIFKNILKKSTDLPSAYQMSDFGLTESSMADTSKKLQKTVKNIYTTIRSSIDKSPAPIIPNLNEETKKRPSDDNSLPRRKINVIATPSVNRKRIGLLPKHSSTPSRVSKRIPKPVNPSRLPKLTKRDIYAHYWNDSDPLGNIRQGNPLDVPNSLDAIEAYSKEPILVSNNEKPSLADLAISDPFPIQHSNATNTNQPQDQFSGRLLSSPGHNTNPPNENGERLGIDNVFSTSVLNLRYDDSQFLGNGTHQGNYLFDATSNDLTFLNLTNMEIGNDDPALQIYDRLEAIWERLGFTVIQKLEMVIKYSENAEESNKLTDALGFWEETNRSADNYQRAYENYRDFLKFEYSHSRKRELLLLNLENELTTTEESLISSAKSLKSQFNDELVVRHRRLKDLLAQRRMKLKMLLNIARESS